MIQIDDIQKSYGGHDLFQGVSFQLAKGERCALVGRNGSGKTTLFRIVAGQETVDAGQVNYPKGYRIGYLDQHIQFSQPTVLEEAVLGLPESERENKYKVEKILSGLGFREEDFQRSPSEFSGGYQLRLHLTKVLASEPDLLLLDEPTNYLDVVSIRWLERFFRSWSGEVLLISHDRTFLDSVCTTVMGIHRGEIVKVNGKTEDYYERLLEMEETHERTRSKLEKKRAHMESFVERFGAKATKAKQAQARVKALGKLPSLEKLAQLQQLQFRFPSAPFPGKQMLQAKGLHFLYDGMGEPGKDPWLIENLSLEVERGQRLAIIGKNGRGKSTILKLLVKEIQAQEGELRISDNVKLGYFGQKPIEMLNTELSIEDEIQSACPELNIGEVRSICGLMMFDGDKAKKKIGVLSGGERSRVHLGKLLATPCNLLLLDEPTNHLDMESIDALVRALEEFSGAVIIVTHDEDMLRRVPESFIVCHQGRQETFLGTYDEFLGKGGWHDEEPAKERKSSSKDLKRRRAELIQERSKLMSPLKKELQKVETRIQALEFNEKETHTGLIAASGDNDPVRIRKYSRELSEIKEALSAAYERWEALSMELQEIQDRYAPEIGT